MIQNMDVEVKQARLDVIDGLVYSRTKAVLENRDMELSMLIVKDSPQGAKGVWKLEKKPCILWIMGGAWARCPREKALPFLIWFARRGYVVASARIRCSHEALWPAQIIDVQTAIRYLRAHADEHGIDEKHIAIMGQSSGGHLTSITAMNPKKYPAEEWTEYSSDVQCAVDMFGPTDLLKIVEQRAENGLPHVVPAPPEGKPALAPEEFLLGGKLEEHMEEAKDASPLSHISEAACPLLLFHGNKDSSVPHQQSVQLHDALNASGHPTDLYILNGAVHGDYRFYQEKIQEIILDFLDKHMKR